jgi:hypothetical protein
VLDLQKGIDIANPADNLDRVRAIDFANGVDRLVQIPGAHDASVAVRVDMRRR